MPDDHAIPLKVRAFLDNLAIECRGEGLTLEETMDLWERLIAAGNELQALGCDCSLAVAIDITDRTFMFSHYPGCALGRQN